MSGETRNSAVTATFPWGWFAPELPNYREADATYGYFDYSRLPPISETLDGSFTWLRSLDEPIAKLMEPHWRDARGRSRLDMNLERILGEASARSIAVPQTFARFLRTRELQERIPSCTACYFDAPERIVDAPPPGNGTLLRFMNDQQWCILWYLYVEPSGAHAIVATNQALDIDEAEGEAGQPGLYLCAPDFETFLYRFWLENCIWFALTEKHRSLTQVEADYLAFYQKRQV